MPISQKTPAILFLNRSSYIYVANRLQQIRSMIIAKSKVTSIASIVMMSFSSIACDSEAEDPYYDTDTDEQFSPMEAQNSELSDGIDMMPAVSSDPSRELLEMMVSNDPNEMELFQNSPEKDLDSKLDELRALYQQQRENRLAGRAMPSPEPIVDPSSVRLKQLDSEAIDSDSREYADCEGERPDFEVKAIRYAGCVGTKQAVDVTIRNNGCESEDVDVDFFHGLAGPPPPGATSPAPFYRPIHVAAGSQRTTRFVFNAPARRERIDVIADTLNLVSESNERNNRNAVFLDLSSCTEAQRVELSGSVYLRDADCFTSDEANTHTIEASCEVSSTHRTAPLVPNEEKYCTDEVGFTLSGTCHWLPGGSVNVILGSELFEDDRDRTCGGKDPDCTKRNLFNLEADESITHSSICTSREFCAPFGPWISNQAQYTYHLSNETI